MDTSPIAVLKEICEKATSMGLSLQHAGCQREMDFNALIEFTGPQQHRLSPNGAVEAIVFVHAGQQLLIINPVDRD